MQPPSGTVTFLFTDIEGSTRRWEDDPDAMRELLARHDALMREAFARHDGYVFATGGDGFAVAFGRAATAVACAAEAQRLLRDQELPPVRMALHTGEAQERDGDYFGSVVNRTARLMAIGHGGQVLISSATAEVGGDLELRDLGEHRLRDLSRPERVFQVIAPSLDADFPALRSLTGRLTNLPTQLTSFFGRETDLEAVIDLLRRNRLVTITGVGGVGKTRLAVHAAADMLIGFPDGVWFCELASAGEQLAMLQIIAGAIGALPRTGFTLEESIVEYLRARQLLVVLDNCEHLIDPVARLAEEIIRGCPGVRVLATSREGLAVEGEHVRPLRALAVPDAEHADAPSVRLFVERARAVRSDFELDPSNVGAVGEICRRLDGLPLALELAAARVAALSPAEIATRLDERFRLLTGGRRTAVERQQTLRATVQWSYALLDRVEVAAFDRLGVFAGSFDAAAVGAIVTDDEISEWEAFDALSSLVAKSLVIADRQPDGSTRYEMLETLRQYAREQLDEHDIADLWRSRHARHYCAVAEREAALLVGPDELEARARLRLELDNMRAAFTWSLNAPEPADRELTIGVITWLCDEATFDRTLGMGAWAEQAVDKLDATSTSRKKAVIAAAAYEMFHRGDHERAEALALESIEGGAADGCPRPCVGYYVLGMNRMVTGRPEEAIALVDEMAREHERIDAAVYDRARMHSHAGMWFTQAGRVEDALAHARQAVEYARVTECPTLLANTLYSMGAALAPVDPDAALATFEESIAVGVTDSSAHWVASLYASALLLARRGQVQEALARLRLALERCIERGELPQLDGGLGYSIEILTEAGQSEAVCVLLGAIRSGALSHFRSMAVPPERRPGEVIKRAREALSDDVRSAAAARGAEMTYDEIVAWLLEVLDGLVSRPPGGPTR